MVVLTMIVERMSILWEEVGPWQAIKEGVLTLMVSVCVYFIITQSIVEHIVFVFPEVLIILLGLLLLVGRYTGYRLLEFLRFKSMV